MGDHHFYPSWNFSLRLKIRSCHSRALTDAEFILSDVDTVIIRE